MARPYRIRTVQSVTRAYSHDPLERIDAIAGVNPDRTRWSLSQSDAIAAIEARTDEFYVTQGDRSLKLIVVHHKGQKYLAPEVENPTPETLLALVP
jgi:hypothetical protein